MYFRISRDLNYIIQWQSWYVEWAECARSGSRHWPISCPSSIGIRYEYTALYIRMYGLLRIYAEWRYFCRSSCRMRPRLIWHIDRQATASYICSELANIPHKQNTRLFVTLTYKLQQNVQSFFKRSFQTLLIDITFCNILWNNSCRTLIRIT